MGKEIFGSYMLGFGGSESLTANQELFGLSDKSAATLALRGSHGTQNFLTHLSCVFWRERITCGPVMGLKGGQADSFHNRTYYT